MDDLAQVFESQVSVLLETANRLKAHLGETPVPKGVREAVEGLHKHHDQYLKRAENGTAEQILEAMKNMGIYGVAISQRVAQMPTADAQAKHLAQSVGKIAGELDRLVENDPRAFGTLEPLARVPTPQPVRERVQPAASVSRIEQMMLEQEKHDERIKNSLAENERRLVVVEESLKGLDQKVQEALSKIDEAYRETLNQVTVKKAEVDSILGHVSGRAIAGDFEKSAAAEKAAAEWLRYASLACMGLIVGILGFSFWETIQQDFQWQKALFRVILAFLLSAPAAYLARESAKHRTQQYLHLQTSLDLKAISPYLASLPEDVQHRIKGEVASKLFGGRDFPHVLAESYPVNVQELLMELIKKLEFTRAPSK